MRNFKIAHFYFILFDFETISEEKERVCNDYAIEIRRP